MKEEKQREEKTQKTSLLIIGLAVIGALLLIFGGGLDLGASQKEKETAAPVYDESEYEKELSRKIVDICSSVRGAGNVAVAIKLDGSYKAVYAQNVQSNYSGGSSTQKHEYVFMGGGSSESAVLIGYRPPEVLGVGIVCAGGDDPSVKAEIISLVSATLDLPTNKIYVAASKN